MFFTVRRFAMVFGSSYQKSLFGTRKLNAAIEHYILGYISQVPTRGHTVFTRNFSIEPGDVAAESYSDDEHDSGSVSLKDRILFNSVLHAHVSRISWLSRKIVSEKKQREQLKKVPDGSNSNDYPISLKYLTSKSNHIQVIETEHVVNVEENQPMHLPYSSVSSDILTNVIESRKTTKQEERFKVKENWMEDYEFYAESDEKPWQLNYGTADPTVAVSKVPCGGCGALLHCQDTAIPGFLPRELFLYRTEPELRSMKCQRCHFLSEYNVALNVNVSPEDYPRLLRHIQDKRALVILMVDLTDFPCSIWPDMIDIIGKKRPVIIVGNKVDLLPTDSRGFLEHIKACLSSAIEQTSLREANIKHIALISATTGFGVEELITKLHNTWEYQGDVYLMGCTNVGKSSLFNALLQSDLCKVKAVDLIQRATTSQWPGTTLNLLKFPMLRPSGWRLYQRTQRLMKERETNIAERKLRALQMKNSKDVTLATLIGRIGRTFREESNAMTGLDPFSVRSSPTTPVPRIGLDPRDEDFKESRWCYDTPGTIQPDQILSLLTTEELLMTLPRQLLIPRTFLFKPGQSVLLAGLARLDFTRGRDNYIRITVLASDKLPVTICHTSDADALYTELLGTEMLAVPCGSDERLAQWHGLVPHHDILTVEGENSELSAADIVLSSAGWISITPTRGSSCQFQAWTPHGRGVFLRQPPLLRYAVNLRGPRVKRTPAYTKGKAVYVKNE